MRDEAYRPPNWIFAPLHLPYGVVNGFFTITLGFQLAQAGVSTQAIAGIAALCLFPLTWSLVWAPVVDFTLSYRAWYVIGTAGIALGIALAGFTPASNHLVWLFDILAFGASLVSTFTAQVTTAFAAHAGRKGDAAGWFMAGSIGGIGFGGGLGLWLEHHLPQTPWVAGVVLGAICLCCCGCLAWVREPVHRHRLPQLAATLANIWRELWTLASSRRGIVVMVLLLLPMGCGAAGNLWSAVAADWKAGADVVALSTGIAGGIVSAVGALAMGRICDRFGAMSCYLGGTVLMAAITLVMAFAPRTPAMFVFFTMSYALSNGAMYAAFAAVMLEAIGEACAATKAPLLICVTNVPIMIMTLVEGAAQAHWGSGAMLITETVAGIGAVFVFLPFAALMRVRVAQAVA